MDDVPPILGGFTIFLGVKNPWVFIPWWPPRKCGIDVSPNEENEMPEKCRNHCFSAKFWVAEALQTEF